MSSLVVSQQTGTECNCCKLAKVRKLEQGESSGAESENIFNSGVCCYGLSCVSCLCEWRHADAGADAAVACLLLV